MENTNLNNKEIKKSFEKMKKALFANNDPLELNGCMYMTSQQICNRTATIDLGYAGNAESIEECKAKAEKIVSADAFEKFSNEVGVKSVTYETRENPYYQMHMYMRINY